VPAERHFTGSPFEEQAGFCRAIKIGDRILVAGTVGTNDDGTPAEGVHGQMVAALRRIVAAVDALGGRTSDIVRTRMYALDAPAAYEDVARAHRDVFGEHPPVTALLGVSGFVSTAFLVEVEAEAVIGAGDA
jgi:enamine deaminase RidA (YjgF/YER057c/UK114 family)